MKDMRQYIIGMPTSAECFAWWKTQGRGEGTKHHARQRGARAKHSRGLGYWCNKANTSGRLAKRFFVAGGSQNGSKTSAWF